MATKWKSFLVSDTASLIVKAYNEQYVTEK